MPRKVHQSQRVREHQRHVGLTANVDEFQPVGEVHRSINLPVEVNGCQPVDESPRYSKPLTVKIHQGYCNLSVQVDGCQHVDEIIVSSNQSVKRVLTPARESRRHVNMAVKSNTSR